MSCARATDRVSFAASGTAPGWHADVGRANAGFGRLFYRLLAPQPRLHQYRLAKGIRVPTHRINEIVLGKRGISADIALRLARFFRTDDPQFCLNLQTLYDHQPALDASGRTIETEVAP